MISPFDISLKQRIINNKYSIKLTTFTLLFDYQMGLPPLIKQILIMLFMSFRVIARNLCHIVFKSILSSNYYYIDSSFHFVPFKMTEKREMSFRVIARNLCHIVFKSILSSNYYYIDSSLHFIPFRMTEKREMSFRVIARNLCRIYLQKNIKKLLFV